MKPKVCVLRTAGTNCDKETAFAFLKVDAEADFVHINALVNREALLEDYHILALPGGFSYGDDVAAGKILANELRFKLGDGLRKFIKDGKLIIGICNGFQILVKAGVLPGGGECKQQVSLINNDSAKFEDRWVYLKTPQAQGAKQQANCVWTKDLPEVIYLPVAHGEGKFVVQDKKLLQDLRENGQITFQYCTEQAESGGYPYNPNGSLEDIAGISDKTGLILGLMPHPERHIEFTQHPRWTGTKKKKRVTGL